MTSQPPAPDGSSAPKPAPTDPYRDWLRARLTEELGPHRSDLLVQGAVVRRGWAAGVAFGPREVLAVLQDAYLFMQDELGDDRADGWLAQATAGLTQLTGQLAQEASSREAPESAPSAAPEPPPGPRSAPLGKQALGWGRRAEDLPLLLARVRSESARRGLALIRGKPELLGMAHAAEWDVQAAEAELRRLETEERLEAMRVEQLRREVTQQVRAAEAQLRVQDLKVAELEEERQFRLGNLTFMGKLTHPQPGALDVQLAYEQLGQAQTRAFLQVFSPLVERSVTAAVPGNELLDVDLGHERLDPAKGTERHPELLRARHALRYAEWRATPEGAAALGRAHGQQGQAGPESEQAVQQAGAVLERAEVAARAQVEEALTSARQLQAQLRALAEGASALEARLVQLGGSHPAGGGEAGAHARLHFELQQLRGVMTLHASRLEQALTLLGSLGLETGWSPATPTL